MKENRYWMVLVLTVSLLSPAMAQFPSNPPDEDTIRNVQAGEHKAGSGFLLIDKPKGTLIFSPFATLRYLNQSGFDDTYTNSFGKTTTLDKRNDIQLQKVTLYFKGWIDNPKFRYFLYLWSANANQGQGAQVVIGGNLQYMVNKHLDLGAGIGALPTTRSLFGQWPFWLRQDARPMADEFFRGSFTTGIWAQGEITSNLYYKTMLGNNLSQLGVDAAQMDDGFDTWSTAFWWTSKEYGRISPFGDLEYHEKASAMIGGAFTRSNETRQSQPGADAPENSQIRLSDGTAIFAVNAFADNTQVLEAKYQMAAFNGGVKYKGFSFDAEYFMRWVSDFETTAPIPVTKLFDRGYALQASGMIINKTLQLYSMGSFIDGEYGNPWELTMGLNWFVLHNRIIRINPEVLVVDRTPVGYLSYPTLVGATGTAFMINVELFY